MEDEMGKRSVFRRFAGPCRGWVELFRRLLYDLLNKGAIGRAGAALSSGPLTARESWCLSAWGVYGLDALPLVLEAEVLPAALLARLLVLGLGRRRLFPP